MIRIVVRWSKILDMRSVRSALGAISALLIVAAAPVQTWSQASSPTFPSRIVSSKVNLPFVEAKPVLEALREELLPGELRSKASADLESIWPGWVSRHDAEVRARLDRGDEDSIVNLLLFGVTFTTQRRVSE